MNPSLSEFLRLLLMKPLKGIRKTTREILLVPQWERNDRNLFILRVIES